MHNDNQSRKNSWNTVCFKYASDNTTIMSIILIALKEVYTTAIALRMTVSYEMTLRRCRRFEATYCLHSKG